MVLTGLSSKQIRELVNIAQLVPIATDRGEPAAQQPTPARARRLSANETSKIIISYRAGDTMAQIANEYGVRRQTISDLLQRYGIRIRQQRTVSKEVTDRAAALYAAGMSLARIGERLGFDPETIRSHLTRRGISMRSPWEGSRK